MDTAKAQKIVEVIAEAHEGDFLLVLIQPTGEFETISTVAPRAQRKLIEDVLEAWSPRDVDNFFAKVQ